jgi:hypothetical protein
MRLPWPLLASLTVLTLVASTRAEAQLSFPDHAGPSHRLVVSLGWESTWITRLAYVRAFGAPSPAALDVTWTVPVAAGSPLRGGRLETGFASLLAAGPGLGVVASVRSGLAWSTDDLGERVSITGATGLAPGWYSRTWNVAGELAWRAALASWMRHAAPVRDLFTDRAPSATGRDAPARGPFALSSQRFQLGLRTGLGRAAGAGVHLRGGLEWLPTAQGIVGVPPVYPLPFYAELGGDLRW